MSMIKKPVLSRLKLTLSLLGLISLGAHAQTAPSDTNPNPSDVDATSMTESSPIRFSGFGTLGAVHVRGNGATFIRDMTQPKGANNQGISFDIDSRLGLQVNYAISDNFEAVAQIVSRYRQENDFKPELTWGFLKYTYGDLLEARAGRTGFDAYIGSDTRDVGYSFLWSRPPVDYYGALLFPFQDGWDVVLRTSLGDGIVRTKFYTGIIRQETSSLMQQTQWAGNPPPMPSLGATQQLDKSRITGGYFEYQDNHWTGRFGLAELQLTRDNPSGNMIVPLFNGAAAAAFAQGNTALGNYMTRFANATRVGDSHVRFKNIELVYEDGPLKMQGAISRMTTSSLVIPQLRSAFISTGYRFGRFTPYGVISRIRADKHHEPAEMTRLGESNPVFTDTAQFILATAATNQNTYTLGLRYDLTDNMSLKLQSDFVRNKDCSPVALPLSRPGSACPPPLLWPRVPVGWDGRANIYSATLDFIF